MRYAGDVFEADRGTANSSGSWYSPSLDRNLFGDQGAASWRERNNVLKSAGSAATESALGKYPTSGFDTSSPVASLLNNISSGLSSGLSLGQKFGGGGGGGGNSLSASFSGFRPFDSATRNFTYGGWN